MGNRTRSHYRNKQGTCLNCGVMFLGFDSCKAKFCSLPCHYAYTKANGWTEYSCLACGKIVKVTKGEARAKNRRYCSMDCARARFAPTGEVLEVIEMLRRGLTVTDVVKRTGRRRDGVRALQRQHCPETIIEARRVQVGDTCIHCGNLLTQPGSRQCGQCVDTRARAKLRLEVIAAYGGECKCCGISEPAFLTIDHIHSDGAAHRRELTKSGKRDIYRVLRAEGYPTDRYQLLCYNCNCAKQHNGLCPHKSMPETNESE